ncbi:unnamed protein product [Rhodiola kirilowii]
MRLLKWHFLYFMASAAEDFIDYYNRKICVYGNGLVLPSPIMLPPPTSQKSVRSSFKAMAALTSFFTYVDDEDYKID